MEIEWRTSTDPAAMLQSLKGKASDRKLRLWVCGCFWAVSGLVTDPRCGRAVRTVERYADGLVPARDALSAHHLAQNAQYDEWAKTDDHDPPTAEWSATLWALAASCGDPVGYVTRDNRRYTGVSLAPAAQAAVLREVIGNPFRKVEFPFVSRDGCLSVRQNPCDEGFKGMVSASKGDIYCPWLTDTVRGLAASIYEAGDFAALPVLADALEEAGCADEVCGETGFNGKNIQQPGKTYWECQRCQARYIIAAGRGTFIPRCTARLPHPLLAHLRSPGPHVQGCWALDLVLGKA